MSDSSGHCYPRYPSRDASIDVELSSPPDPQQLSSSGVASAAGISPLAATATATATVPVAATTDSGNISNGNISYSGIDIPTQAPFYHHLTSSAHLRVPAALRGLFCFGLLV